MPSSATIDEPKEGIETTDFRAMSETLIEECSQLFAPIDSAGVYNMREQGEKERLARDLWRYFFRVHAHPRS